MTTGDIYQQWSYYPKWSHPITMLCIIRHETDPYFNLAAEEYAMTHFARESFMLWRNAPTVIVGRHQNTLAEIDAEYVLSLIHI